MRDERLGDRHHQLHRQVDPAEAGVIPGNGALLGQGALQGLIESPAGGAPGQAAAAAGILAAEGEAHVGDVAPVAGRVLHAEQEVAVLRGVLRGVDQRIDGVGRQTHARAVDHLEALRPAQHLAHIGGEGEPEHPADRELRGVTVRSHHRGAPEEAGQPPARLEQTQQGEQQVEIQMPAQGPAEPRQQRSRFSAAALLLLLAAGIGAQQPLGTEAGQPVDGQQQQIEPSAQHLAAQGRLPPVPLPPAGMAGGAAGRIDPHQLAQQDLPQPGEAAGELQQPGQQQPEGGQQIGEPQQQQQPQSDQRHTDHQLQDQGALIPAQHALQPGDPSAEPGRRQHRRGRGDDQENTQEHGWRAMRGGALGGGVQIGSTIP